MNKRTKTDPDTGLVRQTWPPEPVYVCQGEAGRIEIGNTPVPVEVDWSKFREMVGKLGKGE